MNTAKNKNNIFLWAKKLGDIHISGFSETLCGRPMLGNNYANQKEHNATCEKCVEEHMKLYPDDYDFSK